MVAFTGSVPTGQAVARACAETFKPHLIETSGNDPFIVMPSAPLRTAARGAAFAAFLNCGQVCTSAERIYVHTDIYDEFAAAVVEEAEKLRVGNGLDSVDVGPMVNEREYEPFRRASSPAPSSRVPGWPTAVAGPRGWTTGSSTSPPCWST